MYAIRSYYVQNKQDLINRLYIEVKTDFTHMAFSDYTPNNPVQLSFEQIWFNMMNFKLNNPDEASFLAQCDNTPMIDEPTRQEGLTKIQPLFELMERGVKEDLIKNISPYLLYAYTIYPMTFVITSYSIHYTKLYEPVFQSHTNVFIHTTVVGNGQ